MSFKTGFGDYIVSIVSEDKARSDGRYSKKTRYHDLGKEILASIPKEISKPFMIIKSNSDVNSTEFVVVTNKVDKSKRPVIVAVKINGKGFRMNIEFDSNIALSVYGRNNFVDYLNRAYNEKIILYINKSQHSNIPGVQFPNNILNADYSNSLTQFKRIVNSSIYKDFENDANVTLTKANGKVIKFSLSSTDSQGNALSEQQREYFKDSKVVDSEGKLLVVYHGTFADYSVFDINKTSI